MIMDESQPNYPELNEHERNLHETAKLAQDLAAGLLGFDAALTLLADDRVLRLIPPIIPGELVSTGRLTHLGGGSGHEYHFTHYLDRLRTEPNFTLTKRLWASNALIRLGEELKRYKYFDRHPSLELIFHLRNAVAHNERFSINKPQKLSCFPAYLTAGHCYWEIKPNLDGTPLYDFVSVGDICCIIQFVGIYLNDMSLERHVQR